MIKLSTVTAATLLAVTLGLTGCGSSNSDSTPADQTPATETPADETPVASIGTAAYVAANTELKGDFTESVTLDASKTYKITGEVNFKDGTTLTIPAGTKLYGSTGASYLAINMGAKIDAQGTATEPIIFTSAQDIAGTATKNDQGQWGGLTILGKASTNKGVMAYEAGTQEFGSADTTNDDDNSGTLKYVIIKYSGYEVETDKELNGLSLGGVGSGTTLDNIAVIGSKDDGIEFWGGTANLTNAYVYNAGDDSLDTDKGYRGTVNNLYTKHVVVNSELDSRAIEADGYNDATADNDTGIKSLVTLQNATLDTIGRAIRLREGTGYKFENVQVNVKSSADTTMAAVRISDQITFDESMISTGDTNTTGIAIKNEVNATALYKDTDTEAYFQDTSKMAKVFENDTTTVTGADMTKFDWVMTELNKKSTVIVSSDIIESTTWSEGNHYALNGEINVKNGAELTIEAGTTVYGVTGNSYLAINKDATINAVGTQAKPIIFTSAQDMAGQNTGNEQGQWGGLTILGNASTNKGVMTYEAGTQTFGSTTTANDTESSGRMEYVAIKYSGYEVEVDKELNGLSLAGVGSGTVLKNIAVIGSKDDGIEFWGGTVNVTGLYVANAGDDTLDTDKGYRGTLTNVYAVHDVVNDETDSRIIEADGYNDTTSEGGTGIYSLPTLVNATLESKGRAIRLREGTGYRFENVKVVVKSSTDTTEAAVRISDAHTLSDGNITSGTGSDGIAIINEANATALFNNTDTADYFADSNAAGIVGNVYNNDDTVKGATIADIWKGKAGTNDK